VFDILFDPEYGNSIFLRNVSALLSDYTPTHLRR
jgi:hypothetical protein